MANLLQSMRDNLPSNVAKLYNQSSVYQHLLDRYIDSFKSEYRSRYKNLTRKERQDPYNADQLKSTILHEVINYYIFTSEELMAILFNSSNIDNDMVVDEELHENHSFNVAIVGVFKQDIIDQICKLKLPGKSY